MFVYFKRRLCASLLVSYRPLAQSFACAWKETGDTRTPWCRHKTVTRLVLISSPPIVAEVLQIAKALESCFDEGLAIFADAVKTIADQHGVASAADGPRPHTTGRPAVLRGLTTGSSFDGA